MSGRVWPPASYGSTVAAFRGDGYWFCDQNTRKPKSRVFFIVFFWAEVRGFSRHIERAFISPSSVTLYLSSSALLQPGGRVPSRLSLSDLSTQSTGTRTGRQRFI